jgi:hypothetical protein
LVCCCCSRDGDDDCDEAGLDDDGDEAGICDGDEAGLGAGEVVRSSGVSFRVGAPGARAGESLRLVETSMMLLGSRSPSLSCRATGGL